MADIRLRNIVKSYSKDIHIIKNINLDIEPGEFTVFVGPSGCGKSTLLRMIAGLEEITSGELTIGGTVVNDYPPSKRGVAMVFQSYALYPHMTVAKNMAFGLELAKVPQAEIDKRVKDAADVLQLGPYLDRLPKALSGGQRQRVAIGRAIVRQPKVFLFDEPLSNLDAALRTQTRVELAALQHKLGVTTIYVTHDQVEAMTLADKIVVLSAGHIEQVGKPLELYQKPASLFVAGFIGSPKMNFITGDLASRNNAHTVGIRPEHLKEQADGPVVGQIKHTEHMGNETFVYLTTPTGDVTVRIEGDLPYKAGDTMRFGFAQEHLYRFDANGKGIY